MQYVDDYTDMDMKEYTRLHKSPIEGQPIAKKIPPVSEVPMQSDPSTDMLLMMVSLMSPLGF